MLDQPNNSQAEAVQAALSVFSLSLNDPNLSDGYKALLLQMPSESTLFERATEQIDPVALHAALNQLTFKLTHHTARALEQAYHTCHQDKPYAYNALDAGQRSLKNTVLGYLTQHPEHQQLAIQQCANAQHMTDRIAALTHAVHCGVHGYDTALAQFYTDFKHEALALDKWFAVQASQPRCSQVDVLGRIRVLLEHPDFTLKNPNRARSILSNLTLKNPSVFHDHSGQGYMLWANAVIALNAINPQIAARLARALDRWSKLPQPLQTHAKQQLNRILQIDQLSTDVQEIISKALNNIISVE